MPSRLRFPFAFVLVLSLALGVAAQSLTSVAISGHVTDPSGAVVPNATVTATNAGTGAERTTRTGAHGGYTFAQLAPGSYRIQVTARGFQSQARGPISVAVSQTASVDFQLKVGSAQETVEVTAAAPLLEPANANTTTTVSQQAIANTPNAGNDLSAETQIAPGAVMNTGMGMGNVEFNGLPAVSNNFTMDGQDANDPFLNVNNSGATNLQLGLNAVQEVTINTTSYSVDQGRQGASQINYLSKSGSNNFHGNLYEQWNGRAMNATDFFVNATGGAKPFSNINNFGGSIGGPIRHNKLFFFGDFEATRIDLPVTQHFAVPSPAFEQYVLGQLPLGGYDQGGLGNQALPAEPGEVPFYRNMFKLYGSAARGTPQTVTGCPLNADGSLIAGFVPGAPDPNPPDGAGCLNQGQVSHNNLTRDALAEVRMDWDAGQNDTFWWRFENEQGVQATGTSPINPIFNQTSTQPQRSGDAGWTHLFSPNVINQFTPAFTWYSAIFTTGTPYAQVLQAFPVDLRPGPFTRINGVDAFPQGRNVTQWELIDNLSWTRGAHTFKFGENFRRDDVNDHDFSILALDPAAYMHNISEFTYGAAYRSRQFFPFSMVQPMRLYNLDLYAMDTWQVAPAVTLTLGLRATNNSNFSDLQKLLSRPQDFATMDHNPNTPLANEFTLGQAQVFPATPAIVWQPRGAIAWQPRSNTLIKAGFGVFSDTFPALLAESLAQNPPYDPEFEGGFQRLGGFAVDPSQPGSAVAVGAQANAAFQQAFASGGLSCAAANAPANCIAPVGLTALPNGALKPPYFLQWSTGVDQQFGNSFALDVQYVGNRSVHIPFTEDPNGYQTACAGCFAPWPGAPVDPRFQSVTQYRYDAWGDYNGLQITAKERPTRGLSFQANYTWSHCLDTISNGGILAFGGTSVGSAIPGMIGGQYGNCDYDLRHSLNGSYTYQLPFHAGHGWLSALVNGWQLSGTVFVHDGLPLTVFTDDANGYMVNTTGLDAPNLVAGHPLVYNHDLPGVTQPGEVQWLNPYAFASVEDAATGLCLARDGTEALDAAHCQFGNVGRNTVRGPGFVWSDLYLTKFFQLTERMKLRVDGQFYNVFNHPNFAQPGTTVDVPSNINTLAGDGTITSLVSPPTGLLGSFLGGDSAMRMIALEGKLIF